MLSDYAGLRPANPTYVIYVLCAVFMMALRYWHGA